MSDGGVKPTLFLGGAVRTGDPATPLAPALGVRGGRVAAVGAEADVRAALGDGEIDVVDLDGGALLPAFRDGHAHPLWAGLELAGALVHDLTSVDDVVATVGAYAAANPSAPWVVGNAYNPALAADGLFDARWLDAVVPDRPVILESSDHHCAWVNSAALRLAGITADTADPPSGSIARRDDGTPLGTLVEWTAMDLVKRHVPQPDEAARKDALAEAGRLLAASGVVWVQDAASSPGDAATYLEVAREGRLAVRAGVALRAEPGQWPEQRREFAEVRAAAAGSDRVVVRTVKFFVDGVIEAGTAALLEPYADAPHSCGLPVWDPAELVEALCAFDADGFQLHLHAIGDAAVRQALDALAVVAERNGARDRRPVLAHVQVVHPADVPRFAALGVIANFEPLWAQRDDCQTELTEPRLGPERSARQYAMSSLLAAGATLSFGSDWPVSSYAPLAGLAVAVTRADPSGLPAGGWLPQERLPPDAALAAYTAGTAFQAFEAHERGSLLPGAYADLVHLSRDPYAVPAQEWPNLTVGGTWVQGVSTSAANITDP